VFGLAGPGVGLGGSYFSSRLTGESLLHPMHSTNLQYLWKHPDSIHLHVTFLHVRLLTSLENRLFYPLPLRLSLLFDLGQLSSQVHFKPLRIGVK
jgi:hypothetical protein